MKAEQM